MSRACHALGTAVILIATSASAEEPRKPEWALAARGVRQIAIPEEDSRYQNGKTQVLTSAADRTRLLHQLSRGISIWGQAGNQPLPARPPERLRAALVAADIDFDHEVVVVVFQTFGSGSIDCWFAEPRVEKDTILIELEQSFPRLLTMDMSYRALALRLPKDLAKFAAVRGLEANSARRFHLTDGQPLVEPGPTDAIENDP